jgi:hypothetical protein
MPLAIPSFVVIGDDVFTRILTGRPPATAVDDGRRLPFYITSINATDARLLQRTPALTGADDRSTALDDVDGPPAARLGVLVPTATGGAGRADASAYEYLQLSADEIARVPEVAVEIDVTVTIQNQEGQNGRPVTNASSTFTAAVVFDVLSELPGRPTFPPPPTDASAPGYALRLVPKVVNVRPRGGLDFLALIRLAAATDPVTAEMLRGILDSVNETFARSASIDLNDVVTTLAGDTIFAPNAALVLTATQLRLRVQLARKDGWFEHPPTDDPLRVEQRLRDLQRRGLRNEWVSFLTAAPDMPMPPGATLSLEVTPLVVLQRVHDALQSAFDQSNPSRGIPSVINGLHRTLAEEGISRTLVPLSGIGLVNDFIRIDVTAPEELGGVPHYGWGWTFSFIDACPVTEVDIDVDFRLRVHVTGAVPYGTPASRVNSTPQTDLVVSGRFDCDIDNFDLARCLGPFVLVLGLIVGPLLETLATPVLLGVGLPIHLLATTFGAFGLALGYDAATAAVRTALENAVMEGLPGALNDLLPGGIGRAYAADIGLDLDGLYFSLRVMNALPALLSPAVLNGRILSVLAPVGFDGGGAPTLTLATTAAGANVVSSTLPSKAFVLSTLAAARRAEADRVTSWRRAHTLGTATEAGRKFVWIVNGRCDFVDDAGNLLVSEARYSFDLAALSASPLRVFSVEIVAPMGLRSNLTMRLAVSGVVQGRAPSPMSPIVVPVDQRLSVTLIAPLQTVASRIEMGLVETLLVVVSTDAGRFVLSMAQPFEHLGALLPLILRPRDHQAEIDALRERCLLGRGVPGTTVGVGGRGGGLPAVGDIASVLLSAFGPVPRFGDGDVREKLGLGLPREIINPAAPAGAMADGFHFEGFAPRLTPGSSWGVYEVRDIARLALEAGRD